MDTLELLKSNTIQFTIEMNKFRLSETLLQDLKEVGIQVDEHEILNIDITDKEKLKCLNSYISSNKEKLKNGLDELCLEEYREIKDDYKFRNTKDGQLIIEIETWVHKMRVNLNQIGENRIFIGRSLFDPKVLIIGGVLKSGDTESEIIKYFEMNNPPVVPEYHFKSE